MGLKCSCGIGSVMMTFLCPENICIVTTAWHRSQYVLPICSKGGHFEIKYGRLNIIILAWHGLKVRYLNSLLSFLCKENVS